MELRILLILTPLDRFLDEGCNDGHCAKDERSIVPEDFERMFQEYHGLVYRAAYRITGNAEDAEDVLQTLFLRLLRRDTPPNFQ